MPWAWGPLLPKLRGEIAKFLNEGSLARLSALTLGHLCRFAVRVTVFQRLEAFLGTVAFPTSLPRKLPTALSHVPGRFSDPGNLGLPTGIAVARHWIA
jgi:hypothetical protein